MDSYAGRVANLIGRTSKRRQATAEAEAATTDAEPDPEFESYLAALAPDSDTETTQSGSGFGAAAEYRVRLTAVADRQLAELAELRESTPKQLVQEWVQQRLTWEADQELGG